MPGLVRRRRSSGWYKCCGAIPCEPLFYVAVTLTSLTDIWLILHDLSPHYFSSHSDQESGFYGTSLPRETSISIQTKRMCSLHSMDPAECNGIIGEKWNHRFQPVICTAKHLLVFVKIIKGWHQWTLAEEVANECPHGDPGSLPWPGANTSALWVPGNILPQFIHHGSCHPMAIQLRRIGSSSWGAWWRPSLDRGNPEESKQTWGTKNSSKRRSHDKKQDSTKQTQETRQKSKSRQVWYCLM
jgi:hypothetical protein